jgi:DNA internalization-related competence protein ComEC/Rec2
MPRSRRWVWTVLSLLLASMLVACDFSEWEWLLTPPAPGPALHVTALDIGQGDSILVVSPSGKTMLVDGGNSAKDGEEVILPYLRDHGYERLDWLVLTHPDADHVGGLPTVLRGIPVGTVLATGQTHTTQVYAEFLEEVQRARDQQGTAVVRASAGLEVPFDPDVRLEVLGPSPEAIEEDDLNNASIVLRLTYGEISVLLTGDAEGPEEEWMIEQGADLSAQILKVSHHGSRSGTTDAFLDRVGPEVALISCSADNQYGHPHEEVLQRLSLHGVDVYRTDWHGTIEVTIDGVGYEVVPERGRVVQSP